GISAFLTRQGYNEAMRPALPISLATLAFAVPLAACGSSPNSTSIASSGNARYQQLVKFSECMRTHGVPGFPDPSPSGNLLITPRGGIAPGSPAFQSAQRACRSLMPNGGRPPTLSPARRQQALQYSKCMRAHGL